LSDVLVRASIREKEYEFEGALGSNLLGAALANKVPVDRICRVGLCGACQIRVLVGQGNLSAPTDEELLLLDRTPIEEGVRLACQAKIQGELHFAHSKPT